MARSLSQNTIVLLRRIRDMPGLTTAQIADAVGDEFALPRDRVPSYISRLRSSGLLKRVRGGHGQWLYSITREGKSRIDSPSGVRKAAGPKANDHAKASPRRDHFAEAFDALADELAGRILDRVRARLASSVDEMLPRDSRIAQPLDIDAIYARRPANDLAPAESHEQSDEAVPADEAREVAVRSVKRGAEPRPRKRRVMIVGLLPAQQDLISKEFGRELDLRFVTSSAQVSNRAKELSSRSDVAVLMTKFVNHSAEDTIKAGGIRMIRVSGGMSSLRDTLISIYCEEEAA